jgi:colanic acid/amylovoran biosynthesis protein
VKKLKNNKLITVGLLWHSLSSDNLGVGALTESQIAICEAAAKRANINIRYIIFGTQGGSSYFPADIDIRFGGKVSLKSIIKNPTCNFITKMGDCDIVLDIGEGDSFTDIYGMKRYLVNMLSLEKIYL